MTGRPRFRRAPTSSRALKIATAIALALVSTTLVAGPASARAATVRTCISPSGPYTVTLPAHPGPAAGADPYEQFAVNCTIGYHEKKGFPFSLIGVVLIATAATLILLHTQRGRMLDAAERSGIADAMTADATGGDA